MIFDYLSGFEKRIADLWIGNFVHSFAVTSHYSWRTWRAHKDCREPQVWSCSSLREASSRYSWSENSNEESFEGLSKRLIDLVGCRRDEEVVSVCVAIFKWGGVARSKDDRSVQWLRNRCADKILSDDLLEGVEALRANTAPLKKFNGRQLIMNSAMTKVYAALAPDDLVIYDGRVGAALGLLARDYLDSIQHDGPLPPELAFRWGASRSRNGVQGQNGRNPSRGDLRFPALFGANPDLAHAEMMRRASGVLKRVALLIDQESSEVFRQLERSLFMIGYDVSRRGLGWKE